MWRDQSDRLVCNQHYVMHYYTYICIQEFSHFSRDYETVNDALCIDVVIIEFRWNNSMYAMLPDPIPEK